jgi:CHAT domain-containing protein
MPDRALVVGDPPFREAHLLAATNRAPSRTRGTGFPEPSVLRDALGADRDALGRLPRLGWSRREARAVERCFNESIVHLGAEANEGQLRSLVQSRTLEGFPVVHIATHALVDSRRPLQSALVLAQVGSSARDSSAAADDGLLTGLEIASSWRLDADLVTLSSCETATGRTVQGEGVVGFAYPFLAAGARAMLLSLWKVGDEATALLMGRFYENWRGRFEGTRSGKRPGTLTKAESLREAKQWLRAGADGADRRRFAHPWDWSGFVLLGDAR